MYYGKRTKSKSEIPFCILKQHCSFCVNNSNGGIFVVVVVLEDEILCRKWFSLGVEAGPAFSTSDFAGLCSGLWHRASVLARVSVVYLLWYEQSCFALFRLRFLFYILDVLHIIAF